MGQNFRKIIAVIIIFISLVSGAKAQDVIVKTDKSEIKAKVVEIADLSIKYKKWDNQDGPLYNIAKADVFMIIYANGQREIIKQVQKMNTGSTQTVSNNSNTGLANSLQEAGNDASIDTTVEYKNIKIKYRPTRILYWFDTPPTTLGIQQEMRIVKNTLNIGTEVDYFFVSGASQILYSLYASPYLPLNRLMKNYQNQDKGLFINGKIGYSSLSVQIGGTTATEGGLMLGFGADYFISKSIGISLAGFKFKDSKINFQGGLCFNIL
jgi:hypothetical protein